jgi:hypothetical protein
MKVVLPAGRNWPDNGTLVEMKLADLYGQVRGAVFDVRATFHLPPELVFPVDDKERPHGKACGRTRGLRDRINMHWESDRFGFGYQPYGVDLHTYSYLEGRPPWVVGGEANRFLCSVPYETPVDLQLWFGPRATLYRVRRDGKVLASAVVQHRAGGWDVGAAGSLYQGGEADTRLPYDYAVTLVRI